MNNCASFDQGFLHRLSNLALECSRIDPGLYGKYDVKRGLRDISGKGVLAGLTEISEIYACDYSGNETIPCEGRLFYRGMDVRDLVNGFLGENRYGFEETCYLLLFGDLPDSRELALFEENLAKNRRLPDGFVRDMILKATARDMMNMLSRSLLALYSYDDRADDTSIQNVLRQCLEMIAYFPLLAVYGYQAYSHYHGNNSLIIHSPRQDLSTAENVLHMLRPDSRYSRLEATLLDLALVLHAEHGGGNNSTFTTHVVTSSGTDTYSAFSAALGSLKGPRHGGANVKVVKMFEDIKNNVRDWDDEDEIAGYLEKLLNREAFDRSGLIYGMGHAVYSLSDPRAEIFKSHVGDLAREKGLEKEFGLYTKVERIAPKVIGRLRKIYKGVSANIDFYSGLVYGMLGIPIELFTPIFAISRIAGWSAHRIEEIANNGKIIRPAYKSITERRPYVRLSDRKSAE